MAKTGPFGITTKAAGGVSRLPDPKLFIPPVLAHWSADLGIDPKAVAVEEPMPSWIARREEHDARLARFGKMIEMHTALRVERQAELPRIPRPAPPETPVERFWTDSLETELERLADAEARERGPARWASPSRNELIAAGLVEIVKTERDLWMGDRLTSAGRARLRNQSCKTSTS